ncbi:MAG: hypothetical protein IKH02_12690 [Prevotella sp.]|nr:hypothetical protein [Prevotella sp.]
MKKVFYFISLAFCLIFCSCSSSDATAYKDLVFGMSLEEVIAKGYSDGVLIRAEEGREYYKCNYSDFAGCLYERAEVSFRDNKLAEVHFYNSTDNPEIQRDFSKKVTDYLTSKYGPAKTAGKCEGWKDNKKTFLLYIHVDLDGISSKYINELAICSNDYYQAK